MTDLYRGWVSGRIIQMAKDDPELVLEVIKQLKSSGEIAVDELAHIERIARRWVKIAQDNLGKAQRQSCGGSFAFAKSCAILSKRSGLTSPRA